MSSQRDQSADDLATPENLTTAPSAALTRRQIRERERAAEAAARAAEYAVALARPTFAEDVVDSTGAPTTPDRAGDGEESVEAPAAVITETEVVDAADGAASEAADVADDNSDAGVSDAAVEVVADYDMEVVAAEGAVDDVEVADDVSDRAETADLASEESVSSATEAGEPAPEEPDVVTDTDASGPRGPRNRTDSRGPAGRSPRARRWVPRLAVLAALGIATTVVPLTGAALPDKPSDEAVAPLLTATSALDVFAGGAYAPADASAALAADPQARARALAAASRDTGAREELTCGAAAFEANGVVAAEETIVPVDLVMPLTAGSYSFTSRYGYRSHPIYGGYGEHTGTDLAAAAGTPIHSIADGEVIYAGGGKDGRSGMLVIVQHEIDGDPVWSWYVHMYPNGVFVDVGQQVAAGEVIGAVGSYGNSTGPHLHLEIHLDQDLTTVDPQAWLASHDAAPLTSDTPLCSEG
ncbi:M23 family metallopeptidase [Occultella glacieicola]|uniref:M23 family metallopeptidase n=1 Tax=Occultella glacieicola TaxID=2518684 RepID=A0ABY2E791_9MICO|nr:M23 family metallopeptidase [Occultella glacieicola]TDE96042.1 M23 family metallopeptidase [Occultella glacieicola]